MSQFKERPILMNGAMVRATLAGSKTQTRRIMNPVPQMVTDKRTAAWEGPPEALMDLLDKTGRACPFGKVGDRLYVRETFVQGWPMDPITDRFLQFDAEGNELPKKTWYRATDNINWSDDDGWETNIPWKPSIHMPRAASRILLEIFSVHIERLQDISEADAIAEGIEPMGNGLWRLYGSKSVNSTYSTRLSFQSLWESINGPGSWDANPWVWVVEFKRIENGVTA